MSWVLTADKVTMKSSIWPSVAVLSAIVIVGSGATVTVSDEVAVYVPSLTVNVG
jgi:hypothetical protein